MSGRGGVLRTDRPPCRCRRASSGHDSSALSGKCADRAGLRGAADALWLQALIWPEQRERAQLLRQAMTIAKQYPPRLLSGDGLRVLPDVLRTVPKHAAVCVFHTHTINQLSVPARDRLSTLLAEYGTTRDLYRVSAGRLGTPSLQLELTAWQHGRASQRLLAYCDAHGRWLEWLGG